MKKLLASTVFAGTSLLVPALTFHPITDIATPNMVEGNAGGNPLTNLIEGAGVGFDSIEPHARLGGTWYTTAPGGFPSDYIVANSGDEIIILDLGADTTLYEMSYWGYAAGNTNGGKDYTLRFATDGEGGTTALGDENFGNSITYTPSFDAAFNADNRGSNTFSQAVTARYVELTFTDNWRGLQGGTPGGDRVGLGEIAFEDSVPPVDPLLQVGTSLNLDLDGSVQTIEIPVANLGATQSLTLSTPTFNGTNSAAFSLLSSPASIGAAENDTIRISFNPTDLTGAIGACLNFTSNDTTHPSVSISLSGFIHDPRISAVTFFNLGSFPSGSYLNGVEIASRNAPANPTWNSVATQNADENNNLETIDVSAFLANLQNGPNVLAIHLLNRNIGSSDLVADASLNATSAPDGPLSIGYLSVATPGSLNTGGSAHPGPQILEVTHSPEQPSETENIIVNATVLPRHHHQSGSRRHCDHFGTLIRSLGMARCQRSPSSRLKHEQRRWHGKQYFRQCDRICARRRTSFFSAESGAPSIKKPAPVIRRGLFFNSKLLLATVPAADLALGILKFEISDAADAVIFPEGADLHRLHRKDVIHLHDLGDFELLERRRLALSSVGTLAISHHPHQSPLVLGDPDTDFTIAARLFGIGDVKAPALLPLELFFAHDPWVGPVKELEGEIFVTHIGIGNGSRNLGIRKRAGFSIGHNFQKILAVFVQTKVETLRPSLEGKLDVLPPEKESDGRLGGSFTDDSGKVLLILKSSNLTDRRHDFLGRLGRDERRDCEEESGDCFHAGFLTVQQLGRQDELIHSIRMTNDFVNKV